MLYPVVENVLEIRNEFLFYSHLNDVKLVIKKTPVLLLLILVLISIAYDETGF